MTRQNNNHKLTFALIGCGRISQVHLTVLSKEPRANLVAVADIDPQAASSVGETFGVKAFEDADTMLAAMHPDAVVICSPPNTHQELAEAAFSNGAHVLCEKPFTIHVEDAEAMVARSNDAGKVLMMASKFRYVDDLIKAKWIIDSGILGEIILFENEFCSHVDMKNRWNARLEVAGGGVLIDNGSHSVDIVRYLLGPIDSLQAIYGKRWQDLEVEDTCRLFVRCVDGTMASIDVSWSIHKENPYYIHVYGTAGSLEVGWRGSRYRQSEMLGWVPFGAGYDKFRAVGAQLTNFIDSIFGIRPPVITDEDAVESVRVIQAAYRTSEMSHWEKVAQ